VNWKPRGGTQLTRVFSAAVSLCCIDQPLRITSSIIDTVGLSAEERITSPLTNLWTELTPREHEVAELLLLGCDQAEIAKELKLARRTVKFYFNRCLCGRGCRTQLESSGCN
jgi:DNA-binding NarL/FixJ family response regulator